MTRQTQHTPPGHDAAATRKRRQHYQRGHMAEYAAAVFLLLKGYRILARRWKCPLGEIDLIVTRGRRIAFVEVKQRKSQESAEAAISDLQSGRIQAAADIWLARNARYQEFEIGFDAVFIVGAGWPRHLLDVV